MSQARDVGREIINSSYILIKHFLEHAIIRYLLCNFLINRSHYDKVIVLAPLVITAIT